MQLPAAQELYLLDLCFLAGTPRPTLATLHEDSKHQRYLKTHEVSVRDKALSDGPWPQVDCSMCIYVYRPTPSSSPEAAPRSVDLRTCLDAGCRRGGRGVWDRHRNRPDGQPTG